MSGFDPSTAKPVEQASTFDPSTAQALPQVGIPAPQGTDEGAFGAFTDSLGKAVRVPFAPSSWNVTNGVDHVMSVMPSWLGGMSVAQQQANEAATAYNHPTASELGSVAGIGTDMYTGGQALGALVDAYGAARADAIAGDLADKGFTNVKPKPSAAAQALAKSAQYVKQHPIAAANEAMAAGYFLPHVYQSGKHAVQALYNAVFGS